MKKETHIKRAEIIPAILAKDFHELEERINLVKDLVKTVQIDISDGQFIPNSVTWPYKKHDNNFTNIINEEQGLPGWENLDFEIHLMCNKPEEIVEEWVRAGASRVIVHAEARGDVFEAIQKLHGIINVGLALKIATPVSEIAKYKDYIDFVQCMGIDHIGFQGQDFNPAVIEKVREIREQYPDITISVDGGVSLENAQELIGAGADRLVVGSAIFNSDNFVEAIQQLKAVSVEADRK